jgi:hypothetical protein
MRYTPIQQQSAAAEIAEKRREREKEVARTRLFPFLYFILFYFLTGAQGSGIRANTGTLRYRYTPTTISSIILLHFSFL